MGRGLVRPQRKARSTKLRSPRLRSQMSNAEEQQIQETQPTQPIEAPVDLTGSDTEETGTRQLADQVQSELSGCGSSGGRYRVQTRIGVFITYPRCTRDPEAVADFLKGAVPAIASEGWLLEVVRESHKDGHPHIHAIIYIPPSKRRKQWKLEATQLRLPDCGFDVKHIRNGSESIARLRSYIRKDGDPWTNWDATQHSTDQQPTRKRSRREEIDQHFRDALDMETLEAAESHLQEHATTDWLRIRPSFQQRWRELHDTGEDRRGEPPLTRLPVSDAPLGEWQLPAQLQQWMHKHTSKPAQRCNLFLWDTTGGLGKSIWARTIGHHNLVAGQPTMTMFTPEPELRIYDDLHRHGWQVVLKNKRLHQPGEVTGVRLGAYSKELVVKGAHSIFLMNYNPEEVIPPEDLAYWTAQATWVQITEPLWNNSSERSVLGEEEDGLTWEEQYAMDCL